ncbi:uncharacterized protein LOC110014006 isoform X2 [Oryzias latipes]
MEKSQWDLKKIRFQRRQLTRLDDFVHNYKITLKGLLREYTDSLKRKRKTHRVDVERWKQKKQRKRGIYVSPLTKPFVFKHNKKKPLGNTTSQALSAADSMEHGDPLANISESAEGMSTQLIKLWDKGDTEVVVSVIPSQIRGHNFTLHHSELRTLKPHEWLVGEVIESLLHVTTSQLHLGNTIYILSHYVAGVILFGQREEIRRQILSKINFDQYRAIVSFVNINNVHWKFLYLNADNSTVYLVDPAHSSTEQTESEEAAKRFSIQYRNQLRIVCIGETTRTWTYLN